MTGIGSQRHINNITFTHINSMKRNKMGSKERGLKVA